MTRYYILGENILFEIDENNNCFKYFFAENRMNTSFRVSDDYLRLAEETNKWNYQKELEIRIKYFSKEFK